MYVRYDVCVALVDALDGGFRGQQRVPAFLTS
jgi:hypothetical protein